MTLNISTWKVIQNWNFIFSSFWQSSENGSNKDPNIFIRADALLPRHGYICI